MIEKKYRGEDNLTLSGDNNIQVNIADMAFVEPKIVRDCNKCLYDNEHHLDSGHCRGCHDWSNYTLKEKQQEDKCETCIHYARWGVLGSNCQTCLSDTNNLYKNYERSIISEKQQSKLDKVRDFHNNNFTWTHNKYHLSFEILDEGIGQLVWLFKQAIEELQKENEKLKTENMELSTLSIKVEELQRELREKGK